MILFRLFHRPRRDANRLSRYLCIHMKQTCPLHSRIPVSNFRNALGMMCNHIALVSSRRAQWGGSWGDEEQVLLLPPGAPRGDAALQHGAQPGKRFARTQTHQGSGILISQTLVVPPMLISQIPGGKRSSSGKLSVNANGVSNRAAQTKPAVLLHDDVAFGLDDGICGVAGGPEP